MGWRTYLWKRLFAIQPRPCLFSFCFVFQFRGLCSLSLIGLAQQSAVALAQIPPRASRNCRKLPRQVPLSRTLLPVPLFFEFERRRTMKLQHNRLNHALSYRQCHREVHLRTQFTHPWVVTTRLDYAKLHLRTQHDHSRAVTTHFDHLKLRLRTQNNLLRAVAAHFTHMILHLRARYKQQRVAVAHHAHQILHLRTHGNLPTLLF